MRLTNRNKAAMREAGKVAFTLILLFAVCLLMADGFIMNN